MRADGFGLLIDSGLGPRQIATRLATAGAAWSDVQAVILTHTHADHWRERTMAHLLRHRIPLYCHAAHLDTFWACCPAVVELHRARLVRTYEADRVVRFPSGLRCRPFAVRHDSEATCGFRFERPADLFGQAWSLAYASDLGCWDDALVSMLSDVDVLGLEFNHDERMQRNSGRPPALIARVMGDEGHLSNEQAADLLREVIRHSLPGRLRHVVQLHLSRQCNRPDLARAAAETALDAASHPVTLHTAQQDRAILVADTALARDDALSPSGVPYGLS